MMRTYRGIVCEKINSEMIFMTNKGEFLRGIPLVENPEIGDEVEFRVVVTTPLRVKRMKPYIIGPALVVAMLLIFLVASLVPQTTKANAFVKLSGKDSIELGVNEKGNVVSVHFSKNEESIKTDNWKGKPIEIVLSKALKEVASNHEEIVITTEYKEENQSELKQQIEQAVRDVRHAQSEKSINTNINKNTNIPSNKKIDTEKKSTETIQKESSNILNNNSSDEKQINSNPSFQSKKQDKTNTNNKVNTTSNKGKSIPSQYKKENNIHKNRNYSEGGNKQN